MRLRHSPKIVRELLHYEPQSGKLYWKRRARRWFSSARIFHTWNARWAGKEAFTATKSYGYPTGNLLGVTYEAHRIIWLWMTGKWPDEIDHINHDRADNRWHNLRSVPRTINRMNHSQRVDNTSGVTGVNKSYGSSWEASLHLRGHTVYRARFKTLRQAVRARKAAEKRFGFHPNHGH